MSASEVSRRILLLTPQPPYPPHQGTAIRNLNILIQIARHHAVDLVTFLPPGEELPPSSPLYNLCEAVVTAPMPVRDLAKRLKDTLTSPWPDMALRLDTPEMWRELQRLCQDRRYDVVQIEGIEMAAYGMAAASAPLLPWSRAFRPLSPRPRIVFDDHNAEYVLQQRACVTDLRLPKRWPAAAYSLVQWLKLRRYERLICERSDVVIAVSEVDAQAIRRLAPGVEPVVIPNGVDLEAYAPTAVTPEPLRQPALVFTGKMDFRPNVDAALWFANVLDRVRQVVPDAHFYIVGQKPHPRLQRLNQHPGITITGWVPDTRTYIAAAAVYVVPLRIGGGTRLKLLEAMALERAIVTTRLGAEGFSVTDGQEVRLADTVDAFAEAVIELIRDPERRRQLGLRARRFVEENYGWDRIIPRMERLYAS
ncbi:MAG: glycosyltransferase [Anaerolineae bacterium]